MFYQKPRSLALTILGALCVAVSILLSAADTPSTRPLVESTPSRAIPASQPVKDQYVVYKIDLREEIMKQHVPFFIHRAVVAAKAANADAVVLDVDTPGGALDLMMQIRDDLITLKMPTYAYINNRAISAGSLIAIAMQTIVMSPVATIGGAQAVSPMGPIEPIMEQKIVSILRSEVRATAQFRKHPVQICEAFVDRSIEIPGLTNKDQVLTMDPQQATTFMAPGTSDTLASFIAEDMEALLKHEKLWPAKILTYEKNWSEVLATWLMSIKAILLLVGLGALLVEIKTPGLGIPGAIGAVALALFFWSAYLADLANFLEVGLFVIGFILLILEILVIPGFGLAGVMGVFLIVLSLILAMFKLPPPDVPGLGWNTGLLRDSLWTIIIVFVASIPLAWLVGKYLPSAPVFRHLVLNPSVAASGPRGKAPSPVSLGREDVEDFVGTRGVALTDLRPAGVALIGVKRVDVLTEGDYIDKGEPVRIIEVQGNVHVVVRDKA